jgi:hypothetical protein
MANNSPRKRRRKSRIGGILGVGLDGNDGQKRITRTEEMILLGGSRETHERMQETAIRFSESLERTGKPLSELSVRKAVDLLREAQERTGR